MSSKKVGLAITIALLSFFSGFDAYGQRSYSNTLTSTPLASFQPDREGSYITLGLRKYINSFTSYQFPDSPGGDIGTDPISRLEWPWEQTFGVIKLGHNYPGVQVNFEGAATLFKDSGLLAQDSDWTDAAQPSQKTIFSDALATPRNWTIDTSVGFFAPFLPSIQWLLGYRAQQFRFTYTDMLQRELGRQPIYDSGEVIQFNQSYKIYYGGGALCAQFEPGRWLGTLAAYNFFLRLQGDVGYVTANNLDFHVLREPGPRFTYEYTTGICWHLNLAAEYRLKKFFTLGLAGDFMSIRTRGSHSWTEPRTALSWDGAKVWSEQKYVEANATLNF